MKCAVFSCKGLGDGLLALVLANNLKLDGNDVTVFHPFLQGLQSWFPKIFILPFPKMEALTQFDRFFIIYEKSPWMQQILEFCMNAHKEKTFVLNPIATANRDYPYWEVGKFDGTKPFAHNLVQFSKDTLQINGAIAGNGITLPSDVNVHKYPQRVILHPTSSRPGKNWKETKFIQLAEELEKKGYEPVFILTKEEKAEWPALRFLVPEFDSLDVMAAFVAEAGGMIGNDSGIGHLASSLGLPTVTICRSKMTANFWRPAFAPNVLVTPPTWLPNLKGLRLRDKYWKDAITVSRVLTTYLTLSKKANSISTEGSTIDKLVDGAELGVFGDE
ncbi:MAG: glycosyltransferase family 9 protein [Chlamydiota bacterium]